MTQKKEVYKCEICGNIIEVLENGAGNLVCCGKPMKLLEEKTKDPEISFEKHVPIIEKTKNKIIIKIGSVPHPMEEKHYIQFIELIVNNNILRQELKPNIKPEVEFYIKTEKKDKIQARELCNLHGLWKSK